MTARKGVEKVSNRAAETDAPATGERQHGEESAVVAEPEREAADPEREAIERIVAALLDRGRLDRKGLARAERLAAGQTEPLPFLLPKLGLVSERDLAAAMAAALDLTLADPADYPAAPVLAERISGRFLRFKQAVPLALTDGRLRVALVNPFDRYTLKALQISSGLAVEPVVALPGDLEAVLDRLYPLAGDSQPLAGETGDGRILESEETDVHRLEDLASEAPVIKLVNRLISRAVEMRASDIHLEPLEGDVRVRYRIDGALTDVAPPPPRMRQAIVSRIKILARLDIAERRLPQDGRLRLAVRGEPVDLRVSIIPTIHGEKAVLRVLDREQVSLEFDDLGLEGRHLERYLRIIDRPHGISLVTGPTGSGKTTTLYASLVRLNTPAVNVHTVEDPVEYQLDGISQIEVKPEIGLSFAGALRSILRQDPDIILVGEIRDVETAQVAVQAALTGHLVLSTLHTNSAAASVARLLDMGVEDYLLGATLNGVSAQRLVRKLCSGCRRPERLDREAAVRIGFAAPADGGDILVYAPVGCERCAGTGYLGRTCIVESLIVTDSLRHEIQLQRSASEIQKLAVAEGMTTMFEHGLEKALAGTTSLDEVLRVTRAS